MNTKKQIALASGCGALIGYGLATSFLSGAWVILASILGGAVGWVMFDPISLAKSFSKAFSITVEKTDLGLRAFLAEPWGKILPMAIRYAIEPLLMCQLMGTVVAYGIIISSIFDPFPVKYCLCLIYGATTVIGCLLSVGVFFQEIGDRDNRQRLFQPDRVGVFFGRQSPIKTIALTNPIVLPFVTVYLLAKVLIWVASHVPIAIMFCWIVTVKAFVLAHNNARLACFIGAGVGVLAGLFVEHFIVAMLVGAVAGMFVHYIGAFFPKDYAITLTQQLHGEN